MKLNKFYSAITVLAFAFAVLSLSFPLTALSQGTSSYTGTTSDVQARLSRLEAKFEKRRKELGIPGMSVAIVKDGKVILSKGYGYKDYENKVPMTADTQLAIGSASKAFTALSILLLQDQGKLSLDDHPRKHLGYFKINNPDTDKRIQVRDLLSHSSGLNRTDLAMITGKLNRKQLIKVAGIAKPMAGLREKFYYQNLMFTAAGEIVAQVSGMPWEEFVPRNIFAPLGMDNSTMSVKQMQNSADYSFGYIHNFDTKETRKLPTRHIGPIAPAGSINSSSNDMASWLKFTLNGGSFDGKQVVSKKGFDEWTKPQMKITPNGKVNYGLGWFVQERKGKKVIQHGGNIDGFNSMVAMMPEEKLGFVMLTNVSASSLGGEMMELVWSGMLEEIKDESAGPEQEKEVGKYNLALAGLDIDVLIEEGKLVAKVPGQPTYTLVKVEGRKYALSNAPPGFFITFKDSEAYFEQPQGNFTLKKLGATNKASSTEDTSASDESATELIGTYQSEADEKRTIEIKDVGGKVSLVVGSQPPYAVKKTKKDVYGYQSLPSTYSLKIKRGENGKISSVTLVQPEGEFAFKYIGETEKNKTPSINADELIAKVVSALGGQANMLKIKSRKAEFELNAVHQGVKAYGKVYTKAPGLSYSKTTFTALGKKIGWIKEYFDGTRGVTMYSFSETEVPSGQRLSDIKFGNDFYPFLNMASKVEKTEVIRKSKLGDKEVYVLAVYPKGGSRILYDISTQTFLPLKKSSTIVSSTSAVKIPVTESYYDYRDVDGVMIPFRVVGTNPGMGELITTIRKIKNNARMSDKMFNPR